jgi:hypothetical protein
MKRFVYRISTATPYATVETKQRFLLVRLMVVSGGHVPKTRDRVLYSNRVLYIVASIRKSCH